MLSKTSVDEVCMHRFEKMSSPSGGFTPKPIPGSCHWTLLGDFRPSDPLIAHPCARPRALHTLQSFSTRRPCRNEPQKNCRL